MNIDNLSSGAVRCLNLLEKLRVAGETDVWAAVAWFARELDCSTQSVKRYTQQLEREGFIKKQKRGRKTSIYSIAWEVLPVSKVRR